MEYGEQFVMICGIADATVVCRQLGHSVEGDVCYIIHIQ